jgi:hypothetical protein
MNAKEWQAHVVWAVGRAANGAPERLHEVCRQLADLDMARSRLIVGGYGNADDNILELVAVVVERQEITEQ